MKIVSGGQTGVDRAALDLALEYGIPCGGYCPFGRRAEDGMISKRYPLQETESPYYDERTKLNVQNSDGTLIIWDSQVDSAGTRLTIDLARMNKKPIYILDLGQMQFDDPKDEFLHFLSENNIRILNVAGPRESTLPGVYETAYSKLQSLILPGL